MDALAFDVKRFVQLALRSIVFCFTIIVISSMAMVKPAHASGSVAPTYQIVWPWNTLTGQASCDTYVANAGPLYGNEQFTYTSLTSATCYWQLLSYGWWYGGNIYGVNTPTCPGNSTLNATASGNTCNCNTGYQPDPTATSCVLPECPVHASGTPCACDTGYKFDAAGTSCVPAAICPIPGLTALTDPVAIDFDNGNRWRPDRLTTYYQGRLKCVEDEITARGGSSVGTSAYRPEQYQRHLFEIVGKDGLLDTPYMAAHPECQALRDIITQEMGPPPGHALKPGQPVAPPGRSRHEWGEAFDLTPSGLTDAQLVPIYSDCGVTHTVVHNEPWHVQ